MSRTWVLLALIFAASLGVRLLYLASDPHDWRGQSYFSELAHGLETGHGFSMNEVATRYMLGRSKSTHRLVEPASVDYAYFDKHGEWQPEIVEPVGGGLLMAGVWAIAGNGYYLPMQVFQAIVDALCVLLIFRISMRLFKRRNAALLAAALYAVYFPIAWQTTIIYNDIWAVDFTIAIVAAYLEAVNSAHRWRWLLVCGLLAGVGIYFRPHLLILPAVLALATLSVAGWRRTLGRALVTTAIALALLVPWTIHSYRVFHTFTLSRSGLGSVMWVGLGELPNSFGADATKDEYIIAKIHGERPGLRPYSPAWDSFLLKHWVIPTIEGHPLYYGRIIARRSARSTLLAYDGTWMHGVTLPRGRSLASFASFAVGHPLADIQDAFQPFIFLSAMLTLGLTWRRWREQHIFLIAVMLFVLVPYIITWYEARYVLAAACAYVVWIGLGIDLLAERAGKLLRTRRARKLAAQAVLSSAALTRVPIRDA
jgi:4-amino-4-deoxy-L-arabinose transferase-like glycosyltransferase